MYKLLALLAGVATALPSALSPIQVYPAQNFSEEFQYNGDPYAGPPCAIGQCPDPIPGAVNGLFYTGFTQRLQYLIAGSYSWSVQPSTPLFYGVVANASVGSASSKYNGSDVVFFLPHEFHAACGYGNLPRNCTVNVKGYNSGVVVARQSFDYTTPYRTQTQGLPIQDMYTYTFSSQFQKTPLDKIEWSGVVNPNSLFYNASMPTTEVYLDSIKYTVYNKTKVA